jgi:hypothetical protein
LGYRSLQSNFVDRAHRRRRNAQRNVSAIFGVEESLLLQVGVERALGAALRVGNVVSYHYFLTSELTYAAHIVTFSDGKETTENPAIQPFAGTSLQLFYAANDPSQCFPHASFNVAIAAIAQAQTLGLHPTWPSQRNPHCTNRLLFRSSGGSCYTRGSNSIIRS